jgi:hypothetical protein
MYQSRFRTVWLPQSSQDGSPSGSFEDLVQREAAGQATFPDTGPGECHVRQAWQFGERGPGLTPAPFGLLRSGRSWGGGRRGVSDRAQKGAERPFVGVGCDLEMNLVQVHNQAEEVEVERPEQ